MTNRRDFLKRTAAAGTFIMATGLRRAFAFERRFAPVKVSRDRIIREVVGLRPYRDEGFVVEAQRAGNKLLVHNYGHGGAGITLSWGTASLAIESLRSAPLPRLPRRATAHFAVLGCGVNGLSTARMLQRHFDGTVTIYAKDLPPQTTSNIAGGFWSPTSAFDPAQVTPKFNEQFRTACKTSNRAFQLLAGTEYGVRWIDTYEIVGHEESLSRELPGGNDLYPAQATHRDPDHYFGAPFVREYSTMLIEPQTYLAALLRDFYIAGGKVVIREFHNRAEVMGLPETVIFNCVGLGARTLFDDQKLGPVRGQLEILMPQPEIDYCYLGGGGYMFPRHDGIILGGTFDHGKWSLEPDPAQTKDIIEGHQTLMKSLRVSS